jgi:alkanesulfonate monooxygenase SsuD/methylene tetrahydromethanopterin reductase-like flavin-dependent oxidoreductase (luciferase family)
VEFGLFIQNYVPNSRRAVDPLAEHHAITDDIQAVVAADKAGFKYVWATEHHFLDEYSHLSANDILLGYLAHATERIHLGSGIFNPLPQVNHPAKVAERVAYLDHVSNGRFEFGTGRGAGSHEILAFLPGMEDLSGTREIWEDVIGEFAKMWTQDTYQGYQGKYWSLPPRKILPKPLFKPHPPMWYAAGNPSSYEMAGRKGLGVLGFSLDEVEKVDKVLVPYKKAVANAEPVGAYVNDNMLGVIAAYVAEDGRAARESYVRAEPNYLVSNVFRYHDTMPHPDLVPYWPEQIPAATLEMAEQSIATGQVILGDPDEALAQLKRWESTGIDQVVFGIGPARLADTLETIRLLGEHVIPKLDTDPEFRSDRFRAAASA